MLLLFTLTLFMNASGTCIHNSLTHSPAHLLKHGRTHALTHALIHWLTIPLTVDNVIMIWTIFNSRLCEVASRSPTNNPRSWVRTPGSPSLCSLVCYRHTRTRGLHLKGKRPPLRAFHKHQADTPWYKWNTALSYPTLLTHSIKFESCNNWLISIWWITRAILQY